MERRLGEGNAGLVVLAAKRCHRRPERPLGPRQHLPRGRLADPFGGRAGRRQLQGRSADSQRWRQTAMSGPSRGDDGRPGAPLGRVPCSGVGQQLRSISGSARGPGGRHGGCIQAVGPGAALGAARANGIVDRYQPYDDSTLAAALASCPATLIDVGPVRDPADVNPQDGLRPTTPRATQVAAVDARVAEVLKAAPSGTDVVLASLSDAGVTERLRLVAVTGPRFGAGTLASARPPAGAGPAAWI